MSSASEATSSGRVERPEEVRVWDPLVRLFHWSLVAAFVFAYATGDEWGAAHEKAGYVIAGLVALRVVWGFVGSRHARFRDFVRGPKAVGAYLRDSATRKAPRHLGHNPAGGAMVIALLVMLSLITATGVMMTMDRFWGVEWVEEAHEIVVNLTLGLIALHLAGVAFASLAHGENLVRAMITGRKRQ
ncbi:cytochrome b/b6 domain-containing protein [Breoghania sp. L-A4]|uniref:cytochrome b/b6 domain-containing protein n=1 Tax=Breoghania sp. L-A4 TaxID=2304600 RepID=UPI000E35F337|nr:cytochrome b/b6 domain-containing protein [Breoghania sp. L-A4]AXS41775.1 cytochrome B [Breoghania sp. L-A4]